MAVTRAVLKEQMAKLETNYGKDRFIITPESFDLWEEMFADCDAKGFELAIDKCIKEEVYVPNIAAVMKHYRELSEEREALRETIKHEYGLMRSIWEEQYDSDTFDAIVEYIYRFPKKQRKVETIELAQRAISFYHDCTTAGRLERPTIKEYVEGAR